MAAKASVAPTLAATIGDTAGPTVAYGSGVPSATKKTGAASSPNGTPVVGSMYVNQSGAAGARVYWFFGGSWVAQSTP